MHDHVILAMENTLPTTTPLAEAAVHDHDAGDVCLNGTLAMAFLIAFVTFMIVAN